MLRNFVGGVNVARIRLGVLRALVNRSVVYAVIEPKRASNGVPFVALRITTDPTMEEVVNASLAMCVGWEYPSYEFASEAERWKHALGAFEDWISEEISEVLADGLEEEAAAGV